MVPGGASQLSRLADGLGLASQRKFPDMVRNPERFRYHKVGGLGPAYD